MVASGLSEMYETRQTAMAATKAIDAQGPATTGGQTQPVSEPVDRKDDA